MWRYNSEKKKHREGEINEVKFPAQGKAYKAILCATSG